MPSSSGRRTYNVSLPRATTTQIDTHDSAPLPLRMATPYAALAVRRKRRAEAPLFVGTPTHTPTPTPTPRVRAARAHPSWLPQRRSSPWSSSPRTTESQQQRVPRGAGRVV